MTDMRSNIDLSNYELQPPLLSSQQQGWKNILIEQFEQPPGQEKTLYPLEHSVCLCLTPRPVRMWQSKGGKIHQGTHTKGDISLTPAGLPFWERWDDEEQYLRIRLTSGFLQKVAIEAIEIDPMRVELLPEFRHRDLHLEHIGLLLLSELKNGGLGGQLYVESLANVLALHLLRNYSASKPRIAVYEGGLPERQLRQVTDYVDHYLGQTIKLEDMAGSTNMSPFHFSRLFRQSMGVTPHQYVIGQRVERAKQLLKQTNLAIAEVALQTGFNSQSHMSKWFRQLTGMTPRSYQKSCRNTLIKN